MKLEWNVYRINHMKDKVEIFNVFEHWHFQEVVLDRLKNCDTKEAFSAALRSQVMYCFGWKYEYEICITSLFSHREETDEKIDIRHQLLLNWDRFVDYLWDNKEEFISD